MLDAFKAHAKPYFDAERNLDFLALKGKYESESNRLKNEGNSRISEGSAYAISYMEMKGDEITNDDIATIYPIFSILEDYDKLIDILSLVLIISNPFLFFENLTSSDYQFAIFFFSLGLFFLFKKSVPFVLLV